MPASYVWGDMGMRTRWAGDGHGLRGARRGLPAIAAPRQAGLLDGGAVPAPAGGLATFPISGASARLSWIAPSSAAVSSAEEVDVASRTWEVTTGLLFPGEVI